MATLAEMQNAVPRWWWVHCSGYLCGHKAPVPLAPLVIRWGGDATVEYAKSCFRCSVCGTKGAHTTHPSWQDMVIGWSAFPADETTVFSHPE
jgi:hypothetical protein